MSRHPQYITPEGFSIARPLELPEVRRFDEILTFVRPWDSKLMSHRSGKIARPDLVPDSVVIDGPINGVRVTPYCRIDLTAIGQGGHEIAVTITDRLAQAIAERPFIAAGDMSFHVIGHKDSNRALVIGRVLPSEVWIAYIDPATIPTPDA